MVRGFIKNLVSTSLSFAGKWQQQQLRSVNIREYQGAEVISKFGVNVPRGFAVSSVDEIPNAIKDTFPAQDEVVAKSQVLAGGRGLGSFKNGFKGGVHIEKTHQVADIADSNSSWKGSLVGAKIHTTAAKEAGNFGPPSNMAFVKGILEEDRKDFGGGSHLRQQNTEEKLDIVHIKLIKNNTFVAITDSKGNKKVGASSGCLEEMKGGPKLSRYAAEATAEHVGRVARNMGLKSVVMRVNGFTHFKKKKQAILSWREGYTFGKGDQTPIAYIEDTTRRPHNGCRLPKKRRV